MSRLRQKGRQVQFNVWPIIKRVKQTDNLLKNGLVGILGTFCSQYQIVPSKDTNL